MPLAPPPEICDSDGTMHSVPALDAPPAPAVRLPCPPLTEPRARSLQIGSRTLATRYFLAPLAGYTHLAFRRVIRELGGVGLATTDLVQATHLVSGSKWARELVATCAEDNPLSVQVYGGVVSSLIRAAKWLEDHGYQGIDINMGCPMAKITGNGGGARLMCDPQGACGVVEHVVTAVSIPVTVKMRLGWDREHITAPVLAREFEQLGVAAITIHGRTRQQGFQGQVQLEGIRDVVEAVDKIPVIGNGDVRTVADARHMEAFTGCDGIAIGRGALLDPWIFQRMALADTVSDAAGEAFVPPGEEQLCFLSRHFHLMVEQHGEFQSCLMFRKFAAWYGARLGIPEDLESRLRLFESVREFDEIVHQIRDRHGERTSPRPTIEMKTPNGPIEHW